MGAVSRGEQGGEDPMSNAADPPIHPVQGMMDGFSAAWQRERAETQLTLGDLIVFLASLPPDDPVEGFGNPHSYRGYYRDLAWDPDDGAEEETAAGLLRRARDCMGRAFKGYKGGDFVMGELTPLWVSPRGRVSGERLMALERPDEDDPWRPVTENEYEEE